MSFSLTIRKYYWNRTCDLFEFGLFDERTHEVLD